eukprot:5713425-Amphidinium_carterae.1
MHTLSEIYYARFDVWTTSFGDFSSEEPDNCLIAVSSYCVFLHGCDSTLFSMASACVPGCDAPALIYQSANEKIRSPVEFLHGGAN